MKPEQSQYVTKQGTVWELHGAERRGRWNIVARVVGKQSPAKAPHKAPNDPVKSPKNTG